jgi:hypothetical protein|tara:strand:- start:785 stop:1009 length:225 start_codon:yes stop_codon:yes gene_type:complete
MKIKFNRFIIVHTIEGYDAFLNDPNRDQVEDLEIQPNEIVEAEYEKDHGKVIDLRLNSDRIAIGVPKTFFEEVE